jgi:hypothetical protein
MSAERLRGGPIWENAAIDAGKVVEIIMKIEWVLRGDGFHNEP